MRFVVEFEYGVYDHAVVEAGSQAEADEKVMGFGLDPLTAGLYPGGSAHIHDLEIIPPEESGLSESERREILEEDGEEAG